MKLLIDLKGLREGAGITRYQVAKDCGIPDMIYRRIEEGTIPRLDHALLLAKYMGWNVEEIWSLDE